MKLCDRMGVKLANRAAQVVRCLLQLLQDGDEEERVLALSVLEAIEFGNTQPNHFLHTLFLET